jgi:tetratricopeptide (TPR) repeat protein
LNAEKEGRAAAQKYKVGGFPTILFLTPTGDVAGKIGGYMPPGPFMEQMQKYVVAYRDLPTLETRLKANPKDAALAAQLASIYAGQGRQKRAEELLTVAAADPAKAGNSLAKAYNAVGDTYQEAEQFEKAIALFTRATKVTKQPYDIAYAHISIAVCYLSQNKPKQAIPALEATIAVPNCPPDLKKQAQQYLTVVKAQQR